MEVYHTTDKVYQNGQVVSVSDFEGDLSLYYVNADNNKCVNDYFDYYKPSKSIERKRAIFTFDSIKHCLAFDNKKKYIYKVDIPKTTGHPMRLLQCFVQNKNKPNNIRKQIVDEYWEPSENWKFYEYLSARMTILEQCNVNHIMRAPGLDDYVADYELMNTFINNLNGV